MDSPPFPATVCSPAEFETAVSAILSSGYRKIALQLPDSLLQHSFSLSEAFKNALSGPHEVYILADTSYGSCCVDEVSAAHVHADVVVHFGHSCLSRTSRLPVLYVFGEHPLDCQDFSALLSSSEEVGTFSSLLLLFDPKYSSHSFQLRQHIPPSLCIVETAIEKEFTPASLLNQPCCSSASFMNRRVPGHSCSLEPPASLYDGILFIGDESKSLAALVMEERKIPVFCYSPVARTLRVEGFKVNQQLMRRYSLIERALDAKFVGILVCTLGVESYLSVINELKSLIRKAGKKYYTFSVGKVNVPKLANFLDIDVFVLVACPENSFFDSKDYVKPILSPYEFSLTLLDTSDRLFQRWSPDFRLFLQERKQENAADDILRVDAADAEEEIPRYSMATGKLVRTKYSVEAPAEREGDPSSRSSRLPLRISYDGTEFSAADRLAKRSFQGLVPLSASRSEELGPFDMEILQGSLGTAKKYLSESRGED